MTVLFKEDEIDFDEKVNFGNVEAAFLTEAAFDCNNAAIFFGEGAANFNKEIIVLDEEPIALNETPIFLIRRAVEFRHPLSCDLSLWLCSSWLFFLFNAEMIAFIEEVIAPCFPLFLGFLAESSLA